MAGNTLRQEIAEVCEELGVDLSLEETERRCVALFEAKYSAGTIVTKGMVRECVEQIAKEQGSRLHTTLDNQKRAFAKMPSIKKGRKPDALMFENILLEPRQQDLLSTLVEAYRSVSEEKIEFTLIRTEQVAFLRHSGLQNNKMNVYLGDLDELKANKLIAVTTSEGGLTGTFHLFRITPLGLAYYNYLQEGLEEDMRTKILQTVIELQGSNSEFIEDVAIADSLEMSVEDMRLYLSQMHKDRFLEESAGIWVGGMKVRPTVQGRLHVKDPAFLASSQQHSLNISGHNVTVGQLNQQSQIHAHSISVNVKAIEQQGNKEVAEALAHLMQAVTYNQDITQELREDLIDQIDTLSEQAALPAEERKRGIVRSVLSYLPTLLQSAGALAEVYSVTEPILSGYFQV